MTCSVGERAYPPALLAQGRCYKAETNSFIVALHKFMHIIDVGALTDLK